MAGIFDSDNRLFTLARIGGRPPHAIVAVVVVFAIVVFGLIPGQILGRLVLFARDGTARFPSDVQPVVEPIVLNVTMFATMLAGMWLWLRFASKRPFWTLGWEPRGELTNILRGAGTAIAMVAVVCGLSVTAGFSSSPGLLQKFGLAALAIRFASLLSYFVQGPAEETLFRGWLMPVIGARYRPWIGVIASSMVFSLAHALNRGVTLLAFVNLFLFGLCAAFLALREGGLWQAGAWHGAWNWAMGDLFGFTLDGSPHTGMFRSMAAHGRDIVTGGTFGPDAGLPCTGVLVIAIIILLRGHRSLAAVANESPAPSPQSPAPS